MGTLSKLILIGRVGIDPECQQSQSGMNIAKFLLATHDFTKDKATDEKVKKTDWHKLTAFGQTVDLCQKYVKKGTQLYIEGKLSYSSYVDILPLLQLREDVNSLLS